MSLLRSVVYVVSVPVQSFTNHDFFACSPAYRMYVFLTIIRHRGRTLLLVYPGPTEMASGSLNEYRGK